jgi:hypothetical protein
MGMSNAIQYGTRIDAALDEISGTPTAEFVRLALAALDQAGITPVQLATAYRHARGYTEGTLVELDLIEHESTARTP